MAEWEAVNGGPKGTTYRCTMCNMSVHMAPGAVPPEECPNCGATNKAIGLDKACTVRRDYEEEYHRLMEDYRELGKEMDEMKTDLCIAEREREILQAQMEVVRLIFGGSRDD